MKSAVTGTVEGIDGVRTSEWLEANVGLSPPITFDLVAGGRSNLTFQVTDSQGVEVILRRPPTSHVLPTAHDMEREHKVISALGPTAVPVPQTLALCLDTEVTGAPFYVMELVRGHVLRDAEIAAATFDEAGRRRASESLADVLAELHRVDPDAAGIGDLGRRDGYLERQLQRWHGQFDRSQMNGVERVRLVDEVHERLAGSVPEQGAATIVHGDYRLDNTMLAADGSVAAVLDWEICTLGDPLADVGILMVHWVEPGDEMTPLGPAPTLAGGFASRAELRERYAERSGRDVANLEYYVAFGYWKLACILQGVRARYHGGAAAGDRSGVNLFGPQVTILAAAASAAADSAGLAI